LIIFWGGVIISHDQINSLILLPAFDPYSNKGNRTPRSGKRIGKMQHIGTYWRNTTGLYRNPRQVIHVSSFPRFLPEDLQYNLHNIIISTNEIIYLSLLPDSNRNYLVSKARQAPNALPYFTVLCFGASAKSILPEARPGRNFPATARLALLPQLFLLS
jgi:hypothetical protein